jgi:hypothetical protein
MRSNLSDFIFELSWEAGSILPDKSSLVDSHSCIVIQSLTIEVSSELGLRDMHDFQTTMGFKK